MSEDIQRTRLVVEAMRRAGLDALICGLPSNCLLLSQGYWPVVGASLTMAAPEGGVALIVPTDERDRAATGRGTTYSFHPASLNNLLPQSEMIAPALAEAAAALRVRGGRIGCDMGPATEPDSYIASHRFGAELAQIISRAVPGCEVVGASETLAGLRSVCTSVEISRVQRACDVAASAFATAAVAMRPGISEIEAAAVARRPLFVDGRDQQHLAVMSGARSAGAFGAYAVSSSATLEAGGLAMVHCNSNVGGYWTDITRTFCLGEPSAKQRRMYEAIAAARRAALGAIRPGAAAADVDRAARDTLGAFGFADAFKHPTGHGVGFGAIDHNARPRLHPKSPDKLEAGMVFNVEPGVYFEGEQGMRHCDMVAVTSDSAQVLTPFLSEMNQLILR